MHTKGIQINAPHVDKDDVYNFHCVNIFNNWFHTNGKYV